MGASNRRKSTLGKGESMKDRQCTMYDLRSPLSYLILSSFYSAVNRTNLVRRESNRSSAKVDSNSVPMDTPRACDTVRSMFTLFIGCMT